MKTAFTEHAAPEAEGTRIRQFARIEREQARATSDPKVMAMTRAKGAATERGADRLIAAARRAAD